MIARALMLSALVVMACSPALTGLRSLQGAETAALFQKVPTIAAFEQAQADTRQKSSDKTGSNRCKGRTCLQPALQLTTLPDPKAPPEQAPAWERGSNSTSGVILRVSPPPPKSAVS